MSVRVSVEARCEQRQVEAAQLAVAAEGELSDGPIDESEIRIVLLPSSAELWDHQSRRKGLPIGFSNIDLRTGAGNLSRRQPLAKAIGPRAQTVIDVTAGLGHDAALLACMGWTVTCVERVPVLAAMLNLAMVESARNHDLDRHLGGRLNVVAGDSIDLLRSGALKGDVIYLDPMFEPGTRKGSALPKKPAQLLQRIAGADVDSVELLAHARACARRVVVKRPDGGPPLDPNPDLVFKARLVRYDVYLQHTLEPVE
ncbi:MAG: class I SAM-dependent methyltransferase [Phycisphaerales bacterium]|nr:class I SAM-dependent methyltransferase [Phycisphaerales bacterium]